MSYGFRAVFFLFVDESGRPDQPGLFAVGGVAVRGDDWHAVAHRWDEVTGSFGWPAGRELKWHGIRNGEVPPALADAIFATLTQLPLTGFVSFLDLALGPVVFPPSEYRYFRSPEDVYATGLMFLAERFQHLLAAEDELGIIVADSRFRESDARLRAFYAELARSGTDYMRLDRLVEGLFLAPSHHSLGLQCADLLVACAASAERGNGQARGYMRQLSRLLAVHPATGTVEGVGIKRFPDPDPHERGRHRLF